MKEKVVPLPSGPWLIAVITVGGELPLYAFLYTRDRDEYGDEGMCLLPEQLDGELPDFIASAAAGDRLTVVIRSMTRRQLNRVAWVVPDEEREYDDA